MRYEIKYVLDISNFLHFCQWIAGTAYFRRAYPQRNVCSLYFDTAEMASARDNLAGISVRKKYRLRWYLTPGCDSRAVGPQTQFEIKSKQGRLGEKFVVPMVGFEPHSLYEKDCKKIASVVQREFLANPWSKIPGPFDALEPKILVDYFRDYFSGPGGIRVTIDRNICFHDASTHVEFLSRHRQPYSRVIVEFKFPPERQHQVSEIISSLPFYPVRASKYLLGLSQCGHAVYI